MAVRVSSDNPNPFPKVSTCARRLARAGVAAGLPVLLALSACSMLPPSMREKAAAEPAPAEATAKRPQADFGPHVAVINPPAQNDQHSEAKIYKGTGSFLSTKPAPAPAPAGPEEASLNFEALDVREVAKVILGDYLKQSYTVLPLVQGTVTFRTIKPIPLKDLLPTLEMLLRQNNAAVVKEEGIYKIVPINQVKGSVTPQLGGSTLPIPQGFSVLVVPLKYVGAREMGR